MTENQPEQETETTVEKETTVEQAKPNTFGDVTAAVTEQPTETEKVTVTERPVSESPEAQESDQA